jgi:hypothetical protein
MSKQPDLLIHTFEKSHIIVKYYEIVIILSWLIIQNRLDIPYPKSLETEVFQILEFPRFENSSITFENL